MLSELLRRLPRTFLPLPRLCHPSFPVLHCLQSLCRNVLFLFLLLDSTSRPGPLLVGAGSKDGRPLQVCSDLV